MSNQDIATDQANERTSRLKNLAISGGETMFQAVCYTVGALIATMIVDSIRTRKDKQS